MVNNDQLQKILAKTGGVDTKKKDAKYLPKCEHSAFGNFPASHMPKKTAAPKAEINTAEAEQTFASTKARKSFLPFFFQNLFIYMVTLGIVFEFCPTFKVLLKAGQNSNFWRLLVWCKLCRGVFLNLSV